MSTTLQSIVIIIPGHFYTNDRAFQEKVFVPSQQLVISKPAGRQPELYNLLELPDGPLKLGCCLGTHHCCEPFSIHFGTQ